MLDAFSPWPHKTLGQKVSGREAGEGNQDARATRSSPYNTAAPAPTATWSHPAQAKSPPANGTPLEVANTQHRTLYVGRHQLAATNAGLCSLKSTTAFTPPMYKPVGPPPIQLPRWGGRRLRWNQGPRSQTRELSTLAFEH